MLIFFLTVFLFFARVRCWWANGHLVIGTIAKLTLESKGRYDLIGLVDVILNDSRPFFPDTSDFVRATVWSDDLGDRDNINLFFDWHFINMGFLVGGVKPPPPIPADDNNAWVLNQCKDLLHLHEAGELPRGKRWAAVFCVRWVLHLVGDIHQPLHATTEISPEFPTNKGDQGGNLCLITVPSWLQFPVSELHALWDGAVGIFKADYRGRPITDEQLKVLEAEAKTVMGEYPSNFFLLQYGSDYIDNVNATLWAQQSHELGVQYGYLNGTLQCNSTEPLSKSYIIQGQTIAKQRVAVAGYRLASFLTQYLPEHGYDPVLPRYCQSNFGSFI